VFLTAIGCVASRMRLRVVFHHVCLQNKPHFELNKDNLTPEFQAKNPTGKLPLLETAHGTYTSRVLLPMWTCPL
jgi:glutathione S-transferase